MTGVQTCALPILYFDWDIGASGSNNLADFDDNGQFGFVQNVRDSSLPFVGVKLLSGQKLNYWAMDNGGSTADNPGVYNGFPFAEKWKTMSSGMIRKKSNVTDVSQVIAAGPVKLLAGDTVRITYGLLAGKSLSDLRKSAVSCQANSDKYGLSTANYRIMPDADEISIIYPNPDYSSNITVKYMITENTTTDLNLYDLKGNLVSSLVTHQVTLPGRYGINLSTSGLSQGSYWLRLKTGSQVVSKEIVIVK